MSSRVVPDPSRGAQRPRSLLSPLRARRTHAPGHPRSPVGRSLHHLRWGHGLHRRPVLGLGRREAVVRPVDRITAVHPWAGIRMNVSLVARAIMSATRNTLHRVVRVTAPAGLPGPPGPPGPVGRAARAFDSPDPPEASRMVPDSTSAGPLVRQIPGVDRLLRVVLREGPLRPVAGSRGRVEPRSIDRPRDPTVAASIRSASAPPMVMRTSPASIPTQSIEPEGAARPELPRTARPAPAAGRGEEPAPAIDLETVTTEVVRRIEQRAIAQRERLGRV